MTAALRPREVGGERLGPLVREVIAREAAQRTREEPEAPDAIERGRTALHRALLDEPLCIAHLGARASAGPTLRLTDGDAAVRLVDSPTLGVAVAPLFVSGAAMAAWGRPAGIWGPDDSGPERGAVLPDGAAFVLLRGTPGVHLVVDAEHALPLDAGEIAALADRLLPAELRESLRALITDGRGREAALRLARRPLYVLDHPDGGLLMEDRALPAFLHLAAARAHASRVAATLGRLPRPALVGAADLFRNAHRARRDVVVDPGRSPLRLSYFDIK